MTTERQEQFVQMTTSLFRAQETVVDLFFNYRITKEIKNILESHVRFCLAAISASDYIRVLKTAESLLEEISYLQKGQAVLFAIAQEQLLTYIRNVLQDSKNKKVKEAEIESDALETKIEPPQKSIRSRPAELNETQKKILEFVRRVPECRSKEIIQEFSALSGRTIKRSLSELSKDGLIVKKFENKSVYYSAV